jgi:flagellin
MSDMLQRMRELSVQAQNGTIGTQDIANLNQEFAALATEIDRVANDTTFNNINILNSAQDIKIAVGADEADVVTITMSDFNLAAGSGAGVPVANIQTFTNVETDAEAFALTGVTTFIANNNTVSLDMDSLTTVNQMIGAINSDVNFGSGVAGGYTATKNDTGGLVMTANTAGAAAALTGSANTGTFTLRAGADNDQAGASTQVYDILANALAATSVEDDKVTTFTYGSNSVAVTAAAGTATATQWAAIINADAAFGDSAGTAGYTADDTGGALTMVANSSGAQVPLTVVTSAVASSVNDATSIISTVGLDAVGGPMGSDISSFANISINDSVATTGVLAKIDSAIEGIATARANFGATINRLEYTVDNLNTTILNTKAAKSQIVDADYAAETTELARTQIISQASTAMLSQANQQAQSVLALLK